jgi:tetratricopeptide (TPR) repeat protein
MNVRRDVAACLAPAVFAAGIGCGPSGEPAPAGSRPALQPRVAAQPEAVHPGDAALAPVSLPDLSSVAESVQRQIRERYAALSQKLGAPGTPRGELADAYGSLGQVLMAAKFSSDAASAYQHAQALAPDDNRWPYLLGHVFLFQGDRTNAIASFERAHELRPTDLPALVWLAETHLDDGQAEAAGSLFVKALALEPRSGAALAGAGRAALARRAYGDAVRYFEAALAADSRATAVHYPLAMAYRALGRRDQAEAHLRQRGNDWPALPDPLRQPDGDVLESPVVYEARGTQALRDGDWAGAAAAFRKGLELAPDDTSLRYWLGSALYAAGDPSGAEREFAAVVRQSPEFAKARFSLGAVLDASGRRAAAIEQYSAAVANDPKLPEARLRLADALRATGQLLPALVHYREAVRLLPALGEAWVGGARVLITLERYGEAREWLTEAMHVHPGRKELGDLLARVP